MVLRWHHSENSCSTFFEWCRPITSTVCHRFYYGRTSCSRYPHSFWEFTAVYSPVYLSHNVSSNCWSPWTTSMRPYEGYCSPFYQTDTVITISATSLSKYNLFCICYGPFNDSLTLEYTVSEMYPLPKDHFSLFCPLQVYMSVNLMLLTQEGYELV